MSEESKTLKVGDEVWYLPHVCHAFNCNANNEYPWVIGKRQNPHYETDDNGVKELVEDVVEVDEGFLDRVVLPSINRSPDPREARKQLVPIRPKQPWRATVKAVNGDGTVDLDVESNIGSNPLFVLGTGMIHLHYRNVPLDETKTLYHTCHRKGGG